MPAARRKLEDKGHSTDSGKKIEDNGQCRKVPDLSLRHPDVLEVGLPTGPPHRIQAKSYKGVAVGDQKRYARFNLHSSASVRPR